MGLGLTLKVSEKSKKCDHDKRKKALGEILIAKKLGRNLGKRVTLSFEKCKRENLRGLVLKTHLDPEKYLVDNN